MRRQHNKDPFRAPIHRHFLALIALMIILSGFSVACAEKLTLPEGTQVIGEDAFAGCGGITEVVIPEGVTEIGSHAFGDCAGLESVVIPGSVITIAPDAFDGSPNVVATVVKGSIAEEYCEEYGIGHESQDDPYGQNGSDDAHYYNGHTYRVFDEYRNWNDAESYCESLGGHLATITSEHEQLFIESILQSRNNYFLGGTDAGSEGNWRWVTGEAWDYSNWHSAAPDNYYGNENYLIIYNIDRFGSSKNTWNDHNATGYYSDDLNGLWKYPSQCGFICEWETNYLRWADGSTVSKKLAATHNETVELIPIRTNAEWYASAPLWIALSPTIGNSNRQNGQFTIEATIQANPDETARRGIITIYVDGCPFLEMEVSQEANVPEKVTLRPQTWNLGWERKEGKSGTVTVAGQSVYLNPDVRGTTNKKLTYTSSNPGVATVSQTGRVTAVSPGETTITAATENGVSDSHVMHVYASPFKWEDIPEAMKRSNRTVAQLMDLYYTRLNTDTDELIDGLEENVKSIINLDPNLDAEAQKTIRDKMNDIIKGFKYDVSSYSGVKTGADLANKILSELIDDTVGGFTFTCKNVDYTVSYDVTVNFWGNIVSLNPGGIRASNGKTYTWQFFSQNSKSIESEMIYLKQFADMKIQEARDTAYSDAVKVLGIGEYVKQVSDFFKKVKSLPGSAAWSFIESRFPDFARLVNGAKALETKFQNVKNAYEGLKPPDWTGDLGSKVVSDITGYHEKVNTFIEAIDALIG